MLTERTVASITATIKSQKKADRDGLYLYVTPRGAKSWRYDYRFGGKRFTLTFGLYPDLGLKDARRKHHEARTQLAEDKNPAQLKRQKKLTQRVALNNSFEEVAAAWFASKSDRRSAVWRQAHQLNLKRLKDVASTPLGEISAEELLGLLEKGEAKFGAKSAERIRQTAIQVFDYGRRKLKITANVARGLAGWVEVPVAKHRPWLKESELPDFLDALDEYPGYPTTKYAAELLLRTMVRKGELLGAKWAEIKFADRLWVVPAERMKMLTEHKINRHNSHDVPLSRQAIQLLKELRPICSGSEFLFPSNSSLEKPISPSTLNVMFRRMGYSGLLTPHGIRATVSTILNERGFRGDLIERQLAHVERNGTRAAYNHAQYLEERYQMMQAWSDILDDIRSITPSKEST